MATTEIKSINGHPIVPSDVEDGSIDTADLANGAVTLAKLDSTLAASIPMSPLTDAEIDVITEI